MAGQDLHTHGGTAILATHGTTGAGVAVTTHIGVGVGALAGAVILTTLDLSHHITITTTIHHTMAADITIGII